MQLRPKHALADTAAHDMALSDDLTAELWPNFGTLAAAQAMAGNQDWAWPGGKVRACRFFHYDYEWSTSSC